jgi:hypothetical protein
MSYRWLLFPRLNTSEKVAGNCHEDAGIVRAFGERDDFERKRSQNETAVCGKQGFGAGKMAPTLVKPWVVCVKTLERESFSGGGWVRIAVIWAGLVRCRALAQFGNPLLTYSLFTKSSRDSG